MEKSFKATLRIATRKSPLALWQANYVKFALEAAHPQLHIDVMGLLTEGDKLLATSISLIGGKGLFVKELEQAILERRADIAVHSIKDMTTTYLNGLTLAAVCKRDDPRDVFISNRFASLEELPAGATVGTSSNRRACLLRALYPKVNVVNLRGNVGTRLRKLDEGHFDAIILAAAGLNRLKETTRLQSILDPDPWVPAVGQGAIGIECREDDHQIVEYLTALEDQESRICITAERSMNEALNGGCQLPIGAYAYIADNRLYLSGMVGDANNRRLLYQKLNGSPLEPEYLGEQVAKSLLDQGADKILYDATS